MMVRIMDRKSFTIFSLVGFAAMVAIQLGEIWLTHHNIDAVFFIVQWLPLYLAWGAMVAIALFYRKSDPEHKPNWHIQL